MDKPVVVIADKLAPSTVSALGDGVRVEWVEGPNRQELLGAVGDAEALLVRSATRVDAQVMDAAPRLQVIARAGVGLDNVDVAAATQRGIMVVNAPTSNIHSACEHALALLLACARQIPAADASLRQGEWKRSSFKGVEVYGKTVGIVGFGHIGQLLAQRLRAFEARVIAHDPYANPARAAAMGVELLGLEELMGQADFVSIHLPKTPETTNMFDARLLAKAKPGQILVNAARGGLVDEAALAESIRAGRHRGAGIDVYAQEPCTNSPLFELAEVVVTPHLGASTVEAQDRAGLDVAASVLRALAGEFVPEAVNIGGHRVGEEVAQWMDLSRKLGLGAGTLLGQAPVAIEVTANGELSTQDVSALGLAAVRGLFSGVTDQEVTFVNAMEFARQRGVELTVRTEPKSYGHRSSLKVKAIAADGHTCSLVGARTGEQEVEKIVRLDGRSMDMRAEGHNVFLLSADAPGSLGKVGTILGEHEISIAAAAMSQAKQPGQAMLILRVGQAVNEAVAEELAAALRGRCYVIDFAA